MSFRISTLAAAVVLALMQSVAASAPAAIAMHAEARVTHGRITLADIADVMTANAAEAEAFKRIDLGQSPQVGYVHRITRVQVEQALRRLSQATPTWSGADSVAVRVRASVVSAQELSTAATAAAQAAYAPAYRNVQWTLATPLPDVEVPHGQLELRVRPVNASALPSRLPVWLDLIVGGVVYRSVAVQMRAQARQPAYVATRSLAAGDMVDARDFTLAEIDVAGTSALLANKPLPAFRIRKAVSAGQPLTAASMATTGQVMRGDPIRLAVKAGDIGIETAGVAMADAAPGQMLAVRPAHSSDIVTGRLSHAGTVVIE